MPKNNKQYVIIALFLPAFFGEMHAQENSEEILTLFTTQKERSLIDKNRYKKQNEQVSRPVVIKEEPVAAKELKLEQEKLTIMVSGITLALDGSNIAWVNGKAYENGTKLDDGSIVYISRKIKNLAQIKTPDGKYHSVATGETVELTYLKPVEE